MSDLSNVVTLSGVNGFTYDNVRNLLYVADSSGTLYRWDPNAETFLSSVSIGGSLSSVAVSQDGQYLLAGRSDYTTDFSGNSYSLFDRVTLSSLAVDATNFQDPYPIGGGVNSVAIVGPDTGFVAENSAGWAPFRTFAANAPTITPSILPDLQSIRGGSFLLPSEHGRYLLVQEADISTGPQHIYDTVSGKIIASSILNDYTSGLSGFQIGRADINETAGLVADLTFNNLLITNLNLGLVKDLSSLQGNSDHLAGVHFSENGRQLYVWDSFTSQIDVYDTSSWRQVGSVAVSSPIGIDQFLEPQGQMVLSGDGRLLFLVTDTGFETVDLASRLSLTVAGDSSGNVLYGDVGDDSLNGGGGNDTLDGGAGSDTLNGGAGSDTASYADATAKVTVNLGLQGSAQNTGGAGADTLISIESVIGSAYGDVLYASSAGGGALYGGAGDDTIFAGAGPDTIDGGTGTNWADYYLGGITSGVTVNLNLHGVAQNTGGGGTDTLANIQNLQGSAYDDVLIGDAHDNNLQGRAGDDTLDGGAGDDTLNGGPGVDTASYADAASAVTVSLLLEGSAQNTHGAGSDTLINIENLTGSSHSDTLTGDANNNVLIGGGGDDTLYGGAGDDTLIGGVGSDTLTGGPGADHFVFTSVNDSTYLARDHIQDFSHVQGDKIDLSQIDANTNLAGDQAFTLASSFTHVAGQLIEIAKPGGYLVEGDVNGDGTADLVIFVTTSTALVGSDFIL